MRGEIIAPTFQVSYNIETLDGVETRVLNLGGIHKIVFERQLQIDGITVPLEIYLSDIEPYIQWRTISINQG